MKAMTLAGSREHGNLGEEVRGGLRWWLGWQRIGLSMQDMQVQSLGQDDALEKERATHSRILAWEIPWTEEPGGLWSVRSKESNKTQ